MGKIVKQLKKLVIGHKVDSKSFIEFLRQHRIYRDKEKAHPSLKLNTQKYVHFSSAGRTESSRQGFPVSQIQIRQCEHDIQFGGLFSQTPISCFSISE